MTYSIQRRHVLKGGGLALAAGLVARPAAASVEAENTELIGMIYQAFGSGDLPFILSKVGPDTTFGFNVTNSPVPWHAPATGPQEITAFFAALGEQVRFEDFAPLHFIASGEDVVAQVRLAYSINRNGSHVAEQNLHWWTVRNGIVASLMHFEDTAQVIAAWNA